MRGSAEASPRSVPRSHLLPPWLACRAPPSPSCPPFIPCSLSPLSVPSLLCACLLPPCVLTLFLLRRHLLQVARLHRLDPRRLERLWHLHRDAAAAAPAAPAATHAAQESNGATLGRAGQVVGQIVGLPVAGDNGIAASAVGQQLLHQLRVCVSRERTSACVLWHTAPHTCACLLYVCSSVLPCLRAFLVLCNLSFLFAVPHARYARADCVTPQSDKP